jgi:hypothetical protein
MTTNKRSLAVLAAIGVSAAAILTYSILYPASPAFNPVDVVMQPVRSQAACVAPPLLAHSVAPHTTLTYRLIGFPSGQSDSADLCIRRAFQIWNDALHDIDIQFVYQPDATQQTNLVVYLGSLPAGTGGAITPVTRGSNGYVAGTGILINNDTRTLSSCLGYYKVGLHEIGHVLGLGHPFSSGESSVMNNMGGVNDVINDMPVVPTACDVEQVRQASMSPRLAVSQ